MWSEEEHMSEEELHPYQAPINLLEPAPVQRLALLAGLLPRLLVLHRTYPSPLGFFSFVHYTLPVVRGHPKYLLLLAVSQRGQLQFDYQQEFDFSHLTL